MRGMARQKPPKPNGRITGFPYDGLWEEMRSVRETLGTRTEDLARYEKLLAEREERGFGGRAFPALNTVRQIVSELALDDAEASDLSERLYRIAAAFCLPALKRELKRDNTSVSRRLKQLGAAAAKLAAKIDTFDRHEEVYLDLNRFSLVPQAEGKLFDLRKLASELRDLSSSSVRFADDMPRMPRGTSVKILQARLMLCTTAAINEVCEDELLVKQADSAGRNPRPGSKSAEALFRYLELVDPRMTDATKVRLFAEFNCPRFAATLEDIENDRPPLKWLKRQQAIGRLAE